MSKFMSLAAIAACLALPVAASAQTAAPAAPQASPGTAPAGKPTAAKTTRTAKSLECSKEADSKNIHGKARKSFMSTCKKG